MVFSASEIEYCEKNSHPAEHFAGRFAAKEAFLKALGSGFTISYELNQIIVINDEKGAPYIKLSGVFESLEKEWNRIHLSISHVKSLATAFVILEK